MLRITAAALLGAVCFGWPAGAQLKLDTPPQFAGGYAFGACKYPKPAQDAGLSGCCAMTLDIDANGRVTKASGHCTDDIFLQPTRRCLSIQKFIPATKGGKPVGAVHTLDYEWRSSAPYDKNMCKRLGIS